MSEKLAQNIFSTILSIENQWIFFAFILSLNGRLWIIVLCPRIRWQSSCLLLFCLCPSLLLTEQNTCFAGMDWWCMHGFRIMRPIHYWPVLDDLSLSLWLFVLASVRHLWMAYAQWKWFILFSSLCLVSIFPGSESIYKGKSFTRFEGKINNQFLRFVGFLQYSEGIKARKPGFLNILVLQYFIENGSEQPKKNTSFFNQ